MCLLTEKAPYDIPETMSDSLTTYPEIKKEILEGDLELVFIDVYEGYVVFEMTPSKTKKEYEADWLEFTLPNSQFIEMIEEGLICFHEDTKPATEDFVCAVLEADLKKEFSTSSLNRAPLTELLATVSTEWEFAADGGLKKSKFSPSKKKIYYEDGDCYEWAEGEENLYYEDKNGNRYEYGPRSNPNKPKKISPERQAAIEKAKAEVEAKEKAAAVKSQAQTVARQALDLVAKRIRR